MPQGLYNWSKTASANANADSSINWAEGQAPSSVNDSARAVMARVAEFRDDLGGTITTAGTLTAYTAASNQIFASLALMDKKTIVIVPHVTSGASPTLNVDGLGAKPLRSATGASIAAGAYQVGVPYRVTYFNTAGEFLTDGAALADGSILTNDIAAGAITATQIANNTITAAQMASGAVTAASVAASFVPYNTVMLNGTIVVTQGGNAMTLAIKTLAGTDPSATDPTTFLFRNAASATGDYLVRTVTGPLAITIPSGQTLGLVNTAPARVWLLAIDNAGAVELAVYQAAGLAAGTPVKVTNIFPLLGFGIVTTQAVAAALSAGVAYSATARASKAYVPLGYASWEPPGTMGTAGQWNVLPARLQVFQPGSTPLPGQIVQQVYTSTGAFATGTTMIPHDDTIPQNTEGDEYMTLAITPVSGANALIVSAAGNFSSGAGAAAMVSALFQDAGVNALAVASAPTGAATVMTRLQIDYQMQAGTIVSTTFRIRAGNPAAGTTTFNGEIGARFYGGALNSGIRITELMT